MLTAGVSMSLTGSEPRGREGPWILILRERGETPEGLRSLNARHGEAFTDALNAGTLLDLPCTFWRVHPPATAQETPRLERLSESFPGAAAAVLFDTAEEAALTLPAPSERTSEQRENSP